MWGALEVLLRNFWIKNRNIGVCGAQLFPNPWDFPYFNQANSQKRWNPGVFTEFRCQGLRWRRGSFVRSRLTNSKPLGMRKRWENCREKRRRRDLKLSRASPGSSRGFLGSKGTFWSRARPSYSCLQNWEGQGKEKY